MKVLGFIQDETELYIPVERVRGIFQDENVFRYPEINKGIFGLMFINGEVVPVIDLNMILKGEIDFKPVCKYNEKCSVVLTESSNGLMAFIYDSIKDIFESGELKGLTYLTAEQNTENNKKNAFFVENTEIIEDIISGIRPNIHSFKEILLCPGKS